MMAKRNRRSLFLLPLAMAILAACASLNGGYTIPSQHPPEAELGERRPICTDCHEARSEQIAYERFNHTVYWADHHRQAAYRNEALCGICHQTRYCNDCHATAVELKPSIKNQTENYRRLPHRGDYLTRHRFEGRVDPISCFRCHGNPKTTRTCRPCHQ